MSISPRMVSGIQMHAGRCLAEDLDAKPGLRPATVTASRWELQGRQAT